MTNMNQQDSIPVPRKRVFVLDDGTFAVQWEAKRVQELLNGKYRVYDNKQDFGTAISDYELSQLKEAGIVDIFDSELVYLSPLPTMIPSEPTRSYYLNTTLAKSEIRTVQQALGSAGLEDRYSVRMRQGFVVIWSQNGVAFSSFDEAERAREMLSSQLEPMLSELIVAFVEITPLE